MSLPGWLNNAVFYEIYPQSFYDTNGDGIGDIPGIIEKLDYIESLGVNAIWLNPCFVSPFQDAGYDVADFRKVAPRYGTNEDLKKLFDEADKRGIKIILDLVAGHTSVEHDWFKESRKPEKNKYSNYYIWTNSWTQTDPDYKFMNGYADREGNFMINFFYCQPALNYGFAPTDPEKPWQLPANHPDCITVREEMRDIMKFWLDMGAAGFRVDMASSLIRGKDAEAGIRELWHDYRNWLDKEYPDAILVAEWSHPDKAIKAGFHIDFMVHFNLPGYTSMFRSEDYRVPNSPFERGTSYFDKSGKGGCQIFADELTEQLAATFGKGYVSLPTGNHDIGRIRQGRTLEELKCLYTCLFTLPGIPFLYYGDEIGMDYVTGLVSKEGGYNRTGARTPMQWNESTNAGFSTAEAEKLYLPIDPADNHPTVTAQETDNTSLLNFTRQLIKLRRETPALASDGTYKTLHAGNDGEPYIYQRSNGNESYAIVVNPSGQGKEVVIDLNISGEILNSGVACAPGKLAMQPGSYAIFKI
jgi:glycosidase